METRHPPRKKNEKTKPLSTEISLRKVDQGQGHRGAALCSPEEMCNKGVLLLLGEEPLLKGDASRPSGANLTETLEDRVSRDAGELPGIGSPGDQAKEKQFYSRMYRWRILEVLWAVGITDPGSSFFGRVGVEICDGIQI